MTLISPSILKKYGIPFDKVRVKILYICKDTQISVLGYQSLYSAQYGCGVKPQPVWQDGICLSLIKLLGRGGTMLPIIASPLFSIRYFSRTVAVAEVLKLS